MRKAVYSDFSLFILCIVFIYNLTGNLKDILNKVSSKEKIPNNSRNQAEAFRSVKQDKNLTRRPQDSLTSVKVIENCS